MKAWTTMPDIRIDNSNAICFMCGTAYGRLKGYFPVCRGTLYKGLGYLPYCRSCVDKMYDRYMADTHNVKDSVRQVCRKLDLYWNEALFDRVEASNSTRTMMTSYLSKLTSVQYAGKSYDDTLSEKGALWAWDEARFDNSGPKVEHVEAQTPDIQEADIPDEIREFWGPGYTAEMYNELEQRKQYLLSRLPPGVQVDLGTELLIRQICNLESDINRDRAAGKSIEKSVNVLNTLLGSAMLKPAQKTDNVDVNMERTPFGVWIKKWEDGKPIPEPDPELADVDGIVRKIEVWFKGHLSKMLGLKNAYSKMYEDTIAEMRIERPEFDEDDDEDFFSDVFGREEVLSERDDE